MMPTLQIHDFIGPGGVTLQSVLDGLAESSGPVSVTIHSPGGDATEGIAIYNALRASGRRINVKVLGIAASIASVIAMAGDTIEMPENTFMMVHNSWTIAAGDADDMRETADMLDTVDESIIATYGSRTGLPRDEVMALMRSDSWLTASECHALGLCSKVAQAFDGSGRKSFARNKAPDRVKAALGSAKVPGAVLAMFDNGDDEPGSAPPTIPAVTMPAAMAIRTEAQAADLAQFAEQFVSRFGDDEAGARAAIADAKTIQRLCAFARRPDSEAAALIGAGKPLAEARAAILAAAEAEDADMHIDTARRADSPQNGKPSHASLWALHQQVTASQGARA